MIPPVVFRAALWCIDKVCSAWETLFAAWIVLLFFGCGRPARLAEPAPAASHYCFRLAAERDGDVHACEACADTLPLCAFIRDRAIAFAELASFDQIGQCRWSDR